MRPTEILSSEHRVIEQVLDCLERIAEGAQRRGVLDVDASAKALRVLTTFADECHHGKEEHYLFARLRLRGVPTEVGPVAVMIEEHEAGRAHVRGMKAALRAFTGGDRGAMHDFAGHAMQYVGLLRAHIAKEDHVLFPMAEAALSDADRSELIESFARVEHAEMGVGTHESMLALADELAERFDVKKAAERGAAPFAGCCHHAPASALRCSGN